MTFAATRVFNFTSGYGVKSVWVQFNDKARNASPTYKASVYRVQNPGVSIVAAKGLAESITAGVAGKVVSAIFGDNFYIQEPNRSSGIMVKPVEGVPAALLIGSTVDVGGTVKTGTNGERWLEGIATIK